MDEQVVAKYGRHLSEKVLRLFDEALSQEKFCSLREDWELSEVEPGDIVHITGLAFLCRDLLSPKTGCVILLPTKLVKRLYGLSFGVP